jgi:hypothetical protein
MAYTYNFATGKLDFYLPTDLPSVPEVQIFFSTTLPTDAGVIFTPNTPNLENVLYISEISGQVFIYNGTSYVSYTSVTPNNTEWYLYGTSIDAGGNKTSAISRNASIYTQGSDSYFNSVRVGRGAQSRVGNTVVGENSGNNISTGTYNTFVGNIAGLKNTTGVQNTFIGFSTGSNNTTGFENLFLGFQAGVANTIGANNTFLGKDTGGKNTTGNFNTFIGSKSGHDNTTSNYNTFIGDTSGYSNTIGTQNTFIGESSGFNNTIGEYNTFTGVNSGSNNTSASYNSFYGVQSGFNNMTGAENSFFGTNSGRYISDGVTALTDINTSVFLGKDTKALANSQTNQIVIGYNAIGKGSNTVNIGNTSITNTYLNGAVTVNNAYSLPTITPTIGQVLGYSSPGTSDWVLPINTDYIRRHETTASYDYLGYAPVGTSESATTWTLTRLTLDSSGTSAVMRATGSWTNRATATYV